MEVILYTLAKCMDVEDFRLQKPPQRQQTLV